ncbi:uncharacterized protein BT62DRAFT_994539 [Guyanagaster necrorhizus]|uniref:Uncharacterized protein n=1 Tax=Guyanagaster necrorhizus TaxID=856835 RepID=A0A9P7VQF8_9AGAR|nr:uncharacterized protein BT62DRAFT_994539 [Guyanagaster necrorhizus MCA 3950]KAG7445531.1 hypothetical protein BT62DRAFT_994539 [Guyanagaster necrorhizus MCA 3950]
MDLVNQLNELLTALRIPIPIESPTDLTPSLLLAILECLLSSRLPLPTSIRQAAVSQSPARRAEAQSARVHCMKIFLGILETDILKDNDMGLSGVDPRKLATGECAEVMLVAEALCWIGQQAGLVQAERHAHSPSTMTTMTCTSSLLPMGASATESNTTISSHNSAGTPELSPRTPPRCIHEVPSPLRMSLSLFHEEQNLETHVTVPVRHSGTIEHVDQNREVESFESSGAHWSMHSNSNQSALYDSDYGDEHLRTVTLLKERARLLSEIAKAQRKGLNPRFALYRPLSTSYEAAPIRRDMSGDPSSMFLSFCLWPRWQDATSSRVCKLYGVASLLSPCPRSSSLRIDILSAFLHAPRHAQGCYQPGWGAELPHNSLASRIPGTHFRPFLEPLPEAPPSSECLALAHVLTAVPDEGADIGSEASDLRCRRSRSQRLDLPPSPIDAFMDHYRFGPCRLQVNLGGEESDRLHIRWSATLFRKREICYFVNIFILL